MVIIVLAILPRAIHRPKPGRQAAYLQQEIEPRLAEAQAGQRTVFFVDAAHFVLAPFLGFSGR